MAACDVIQRSQKQHCSSQHLDYWRISDSVNGQYSSSILELSQHPWFQVFLILFQLAKGYLVLSLLHLRQARSLEEAWCTHNCARVPHRDLSSLTLSLAFALHFVCKIMLFRNSKLWNHVWKCWPICYGLLGLILTVACNGLCDRKRLLYMYTGVRWC